MAKSSSKVDGRARRDSGKGQRWREAIAEQQRSGESVRDFCRKRGMPTSSFYYWRKKIGLRDREVLGKRKTQPVLAPVILIDGPVRDSVAELDKNSASIEIVFGNGTIVRVPSSSTSEQLGVVLCALESSRC
jgi:putative transposase